MNIQALMKQARSLQKDMMNAKKELDAMEFTGESSLVTVVVKGDKTLASVKIKDLSSFDKEDVELLEDMIVVAMNDALKKIDAAYEDKMGKYGNAIPSFF